MAVNFTDLTFTEGGGSVIVNRVSGSQFSTSTRIDFQEHGVLIEVTGSPDNLIFVPWSNVQDITQAQ